MPLNVWLLKKKKKKQTKINLRSLPSYGIKKQITFEAMQKLIFCDLW